LAGYIAKGWTAKYGSTGTASAAAIASVVSTTSGLQITMLDPGTAGYALDVNITVAQGTVTATNAQNLDYVIGATRLESDDATVDTDVMIHLTSADSGSILNKVSAVISSTSAGLVLVELTTNKKTNGTDPGAGISQPSATRSGDAILAEDGTAKVVTTAGQAKTRVHWL